MQKSMVAVLLIFFATVCAGESEKYCFNLLKAEEVTNTCGKKGVITEDWNDAKINICDIVHIQKDPKMARMTFQSGAAWLSVTESNKHDSLKDAKIWYDYQKGRKSVDVPGIADAAWIKDTGKKLELGFIKKDRTMVLSSHNKLCNSKQIKKLGKIVADRMP